MSSRSAITEVMYRFPADSDWKRPKPADRSRFPIAAFLAVFIVVFAVVVDPWRLQVVMFLSAGFLLFIGWGMTALMTDVRHRYVRVLVATDALSFVPARKIERLDSVVLAFLVLIWVAIVLGLFIPGASVLSPSVTVSVGAVALPLIAGYAILQLTHPRGLTLTPTGIRGVRRGPKVELTWDQLFDVSVGELPGRGQVVLMPRTGNLITIDSTRFGSDAHAVAHVMRHFHQHENERHLLGEGATVLERFGAVPVGRVT